MAAENGAGELDMVFSPLKHIQDGAHVSSMEQYREMYKQSVEDPEAFWGKIAKEFYWKSLPKGKFLDYNFDVRKGPIFIKWMEGAVTNMCYNMLDRHISNGLGDTVAFYWEGNDPGDDGKITYTSLLKEVCKFANVLKSLGVQKGDRVAIYMPMIVELCTAMLACARIGAIHSIVFGGFSSASLAERILDAKCTVLITADGVWRGSKLLNLKEISNGAMQYCTERGHSIEHCIVVRHLSPSEESVREDAGAGDLDIPSESDDDSQPPAKRPCKISIGWTKGRDVWWHQVMANVSDQCEPEWMDAEDPLFMLYTSGSTGKPKGVLHTIGGYMLYSATTFKNVFDYKPGEVYWCTADVGWITGHTYITYGPLGVGATGIIFEGIPTYPDPGRFWAIVDKYKVNKFYTAPTAIRALMRYGDAHVKKYSRSSLKVLGTVGEPINPEAWLWYYHTVGEGKCAIVDTFWQTETGGHVVTPLPGCTPCKPGSATFPFFGVVPELLTEEGAVIEGEGEGYLVFKQPWPGIMRTVYGNTERFETTYFKKFPGYYVTGDGAKRDKDGYLWITGRIDDMVNVSGHLLSTAEIESALIEHKAVAEAAVVSHPHQVKGECTYCFVTLKEGNQYSEDLAHELKKKVRSKIGPFAQPDFLQNAPGLPKTRSGKIMRRVLRKIARGDRDVGDVTTLADESVIETLFKLRPSDA
ncbi:acetyl-coenzyme A synthetase, cytoplasmic [Lingula anatina]|uniref:acetate--CoA ligase n=1 Tax=Lingula anatina TaxID=7574 RepID=A0A1S3JCS7_LINAN|nr:acetyl-coenzyme A synthetase, cytoplasmic [Lingula anatina]|eukprot:XP_013408207.1 acetyl-coenzyme A synthetase, cytoplasmic [Lingula anatina]